MRSIWRGHIRFSLVTIPIRVYGAIDSAQTIRFNQLHKECLGPIGYDKRCKKCDQKVRNDEIQKGYQYEPDQYVIIQASDFEKIKLKSTKVIEIDGFMDASAIHPTLYDMPYFAGPDGAVAAAPYSLLCQAMQEAGQVGMGKVVLRDREEIVALAPHEGGLVLYKIRNPGQVRRMKEVPLVNGRQEIDADQLKLARHLLSTMSITLDSFDATDGYDRSLREIIQAKIDGKDIVVSEEKEQPVVDIMTALKQSIDQAKGRRGQMVKATGKRKKAKSAASNRAVKPVNKRKRKPA